MKYEKLKALLDQDQTFPHEFTYKFIGQNSPAFRAGVAEWVAKHPTIRKVSERESAGGNHLACTYDFLAPSSNAIISIFREIEKIPDIRVVL